MLDTSYYEKTDQIIAQYSCEEKIPDPYYPGDPGGISLSAAGASDLCCGETGGSQKQRLTV